MVYTDFERKAEHWRALADRRLIALHEQERAIARLKHKVQHWRKRAAKKDFVVPAVKPLAPEDHVP